MPSACGPIRGSSSCTTTLRARLARANLKARLRMTVLYYFANLYDYLVVGTGNRSELAMGYFPALTPRICRSWGADGQPRGVNP